MIYLFTEVGYNLIDPITQKTGPTIQNQYQTFEELPLEFRSIDELPNDSFKLLIGFPISSIFRLDVRYLNQIDSEIIYSQQMLLGVIF